MAVSTILLAVVVVPAESADADEAALRKAVTLYASFDEAVKADVGGGDLTLWTRTTEDPDKKKFLFEKGFDDKILKIAKGKGIAGSCLDATDVLPKNGRVYFPAKGNIAFKKGGWGGTLSVWINTDPDKLLKTKFCDPIQITQKGANNGGIWFDFNDARPRDMRMGVFPAVPEGGTAIKEDDPKAPMVRMPKIGFKSGDWHHIVLTWNNFDTGKNDSLAMLHVDGNKIGAVKDYNIAMDWDIDRAGIYVAVGYIGLLDELALFDRPLTGDEVTALYKKPGLLAPLKKAAAKPAIDPDGNRLVADLRRAAKLRSSGAIPRNEVEMLRHEALRWVAQPKGQVGAEQVVAALAELGAAENPALPRAPQFPFDAMAAERHQAAYAEVLGLPVRFTNGLGMSFILVPPGTFVMGSPREEPGHGSGGYDETQHSVTISRPFYLSKHETTVAQFRAFVEATNHVTDVEKKGGGNAHDEKAVWKHRPGTEWRKPGFAAPFHLKDAHPVVHVSHNDCLAFCKWLQERASTEMACYDLPTEAQWEWACRAGSGTRYWWGSDEDTTGKVANVGDKALQKVHPDWPRTIMAMDDGHAFLAPVGSYRANAFGLHDMVGNVWEFCSTRYGPYGKEAVTDPGDLDPKRGFAVRGGGWSNIAADVRCASRNADPPDFGHSNLGFRVALLMGKK